MSESIPTKLEEAILQARQFLEAQSAEARGDRHYLHFGYGMHLRNSWGLWGTEGETPLLKELNSLGLHHADDMSGLIITCALRDLAGEPRRIEDEVEKYREHWAAHPQGHEAVRPQEKLVSEDTVRGVRADRLVETLFTLCDPSWSLIQEYDRLGIKAGVALMDSRGRRIALFEQEVYEELIRT